MFYNNPKIQNEPPKSKYLNFWLKVFDQNPRLKTWDIDFTKPWWLVFWQYKFYILPVFMSEALQSIFWVCLPLVLVYSFETRQYFWLICALIFRLVLVPVAWILYDSWVKFVESLDSSVWVSSNKFFLAVDPIFHSTQSSGQMVSKINRAAQGYFDLVTLITWEMLSLVIGMLSVIVSSIFINLWIGFAVGVALIGITVLNIWFTKINDSIFHAERILIEDHKKDVELENLQQATYIRTVFATENQLNKQKRRATDLMMINFASWRTGGLIYTMLLILYFSTGLGLVFTLIHLVEISTLSSGTAIALVTGFFIGTTNILQAGNQTQRLTRSIISITDLFKFIQSFGKQTFPVLEEDGKNVTQTTVSLRA